MKKKVLDLVDMSAKNTKRLNEIFVENRDGYTGFVDSLSIEKSDNKYWWVTQLASRNILLSHTFYHICVVLLALECIQEDKDLSYVRVANKAIGKTIQSSLKGSSRKVRIKYAYKQEVFIVYLLKKISAFFINVFNELKNRRIIRNNIKSNDKKIEEEIILLETDVFSSCFKDGKYIARDFENMMDYTNENIHVLPYLFDNVGIGIETLVQNMKECEREKFLFRENYLSLFDYLKLIRFPLYCMSLCRERKVFGLLDVTKIVNYDLVTGIDSMNSIQGLLNYSFIKNMKALGIRISSLFGWYEGQPSSIGLFMAYRKFYKEQRTMGYIGMAIDKNFISISPSKMQYEKEVVPKVLGVIGESFLEVPKQFNEEVTTVCVPSFRIKVRGDISKNEIDERKNTILVALPYFESEAKKILKELVKIKNFAKENNIKIHIKNHPTKCNWRLKDYGFAIDDSDILYENGSFQEALSRVDVVITSSSSSTFETILNGKKLVIFGLESKIVLTYLPKKWEKKFYEIVYSVDELKNSILDLIKNDKSEKEYLEVNSQYIILPDTKNVSLMLKGKNNEKNVDIYKR